MTVKRLHSVNQKAAGHLKGGGGAHPPAPSPRSAPAICRKTLFCFSTQRPFVFETEISDTNDTKYYFQFYFQFSFSFVFFALRPIGSLLNIAVVSSTTTNDALLR